jgi:LSD1 subclass zinc finger protein
LPQTFDCPSCGAPLDYQQGAAVTMRCPYCNNSVIVPGSLHAEGTADLSRLISEAVEAAQPEMHLQELAEIARLARAGNKIEAIKLYRATFQTDLLEAKNEVEALEQGKQVVISRKVSLPTIKTTMVSQPAARPVQDTAGKNVTRSILLVFAGIILFGAALALLVFTLVR